MKITRSGFIFGDPFEIRYLDNFSNSLNFFGKVLDADISDGIPCLLYFFDPALVLKTREEINAFRIGLLDVYGVNRTCIT